MGRRRGHDDGAAAPTLAGDGAARAPHRRLAGAGAWAGRGRGAADGRGARFYTLVARDTIDQDFAQNRQRFLAEQGYSYKIIDADDVFQGKI